MILRSLVGVVAVAVAGCGRAGDHELTADRAYAQGRYAAALVDYREALASRQESGLWAKAGAAALHAGELREATADYVHLASDEPSRAGEAADGLERVARAAERGGSESILYDVLLGLRTVAPHRPIGRYAASALQWEELPRSDALMLLPAAIAAAPGPDALDSLLITYGAALQTAGAWEPAALAYRAASRRARLPELRVAAGGGFARCALHLGLAALDAGRLELAEHWLVDAIHVDSSSAVGRRALVGFGQARAAAGDSLAAAIIFQTVVSLSRDTDSTAQAAASRLRALQSVDSWGDTASVRQP